MRGFQTILPDRFSLSQPGIRAGEVLSFSESNAGVKEIGASEGIRTLDVHLGKVMLYQTELRSLPKKWGYFIGTPTVCKAFFRLFEVVNDDAFAVLFEDLLDEINVHWVHLIIILLLLIVEDEIQRDLVGLIDHWAVRSDHFSDMHVLHPWNRAQVLFSPRDELVGRLWVVGVSPENYNV